MLINAEKVVKRWRTKKAAFTLGPIDLSLAAGECVLIAGTNGSGKSTLLRCLAKLMQYDEGQLTWDNALGPADVLVMEQDFRVLCLPWLSCAENISLSQFGNTGLPGSPGAPDGVPPVLQGKLDAPAHTLSGGQMQAMVLWQIMAARRRVMLLDEPFSNLDNDTTSFWGDAIKSRCVADGALCVIVAHRAPQSLYRTRELFLNNGTVSDRKH